MTGHLPGRRELRAGAFRALDLAVAGVAAIILLPVMAVIILAILAESGGPILFWQLRLGRGGAPFRMCKFRKFHASCGTAGSPLTVENDNRMTRIGRVLAATKLDELPQLWNVLRGDMAVVGPRPESLAFADCLTGRFERLLDFKPGLLGPCQVLFRNESRFFPAHADPVQYYRETLFPMKAMIDLAYFPRRTFGSDISLIFRGVLAVLGRVPKLTLDPVPGGIPKPDLQIGEVTP